uniref:Uncharacterized protein n=1 Tax=Hanusia phi TaxID=3032 RepID=A0A7S0I1I7_9CRYP|mmetsp:Transcript_8043/g.18381  ORF Transcript_8043/g.18381 Transcript_8043/m.18381 type:complete len:188 (+) Transcript_8043:234-797(+)
MGAETSKQESKTRVDALGCVDCFSNNHMKSRISASSSLLARSPISRSVYSMNHDELRFSDGLSNRESQNSQGPPSSQNPQTSRSDFSGSVSSDTHTRSRLWEQSATKIAYKDLRNEPAVDSEATDALLKDMGWSIIIVQDAKGIGSYPFQRLYTAPDGTCFQSRENALTYLGIPFEGNRESFVRWEV